MKAVHFPQTLETLFELQSKFPGARLMAGGTDLLVRLRHASGHDTSLICLERLEGFACIRETKEGLRIAAGTTFATLMKDPRVSQHCPLLAQAVATVGGPALRTMGTLGGNICTASPAGDALPALYALEACVVLQSAAGSRELPIQAFITGPGKNQLKADEVLWEILVPSAKRFGLQHFEKVGRRESLAIAVASFAALIRLDTAARIAEVRLAWGSVGPTVICSKQAEQALIGAPLTAEALAVAAAFVRQAAQPITDIRASADYRRELVGNLLLRLAQNTSQNRPCFD